MKHILSYLLLFVSASLFAQDTYYQQAWEALNKNQQVKASQLLQKALTVDATDADAYITNIYLQTYSGRAAQIKDFESSFYNVVDNPYPYIYSLWFNQALLGPYGKKVHEWQLSLIDKLIADDNAPGAIVAAANYQKEIHLIYSAEIEKSHPYAKSVGNIRHWQFAGPFENLSESGYYKNYGPLEHPEAEAVFHTATNAGVKWFAPSSEMQDGWIMLANHFDKTTAVVYAQSFINSPTDQTVICNAGFTGAIKVWINDELVIKEPKELVTELDFRSIKYHLKKGVNRLLVKLSYTAQVIPNFTIRLTDAHHRPLQDLRGSSVYAPYPKHTTDTSSYQVITHFAEKYFLEKIKEAPANLVNYLLLSDFYLRNQQLMKGRNTLSKALARAPHNVLLRGKLLEILAKGTNRTLILEELENLKKDDPDCLLVMEIKMKELYQNEKYQECRELLEKRIQLYGKDETTAGYQVLLLMADQKYDDLIKLAEKLYNKYPGNTGMVDWMYTIKKEVYQDEKSAFNVYENFMKNSFNYDTYIQYANALIEAGKQQEGLAIKERMLEQFPANPDMSYNLAQYYFGIKQYEKSEDYLSKSLSLSPYSVRYWELSGDIQRARENQSRALKSYKRSLELDPNQYTLISKIRKLNHLPEISTLFENEEVLTIIENDRPDMAKNKDYGFYYILDKKDVVLYPGGANEQFVTMLIRITNDKGIERFKETSLGYSNVETLLIEKAQIIKPNKSKIEGEQNGNQIVFSNLQVGDVVYIRYKLQSFATGRLAKEFWDKHHFTGQLYSAKVSYNLLAPANQKINYRLTHSQIQPKITNVENFKMYSWIMENAPTLTDEPLMPLMIDVASVLHISTIDSWDEIANWYSDALTNRSEEDIEIVSLYHQLFPKDNSGQSDYQKAEVIYNYIANNIKYSSVPFRQGPLIPQRASATLSSKLGDCKDLSNLFVTLAHMAGIKARMVLVDTRDNGKNDILLPSVDFNHCIVKASLHDKLHYIELTDNYLPFGSLPNFLNGAHALAIPVKSSAHSSKLMQIDPVNRTPDAVKRIIHITTVEDDLKVSVRTTMTGAHTSDKRSRFRDLDVEKQRKDLEQIIGNFYQNSVRMESVKFDNLDQLLDSVTYSMKYTVKNGLSEIGSIKTFKIAYPDIIATLDNFSADKRVFPVEYWNYETMDAYETVVFITAPDKTKFIEIPKDVVLEFNNLKYSIEYKLKSPGELQITREFTNDRPRQISPEDYPEFKTFFEQILEAERQFIAFK